MVEKRVKKSKMAVVKSKHRWLWRETSKIIFVHGKSDFWISVDDRKIFRADFQGLKEILWRTGRQRQIQRIHLLVII